MPAARRFTIKGRVQGVWFRDSTRKQANNLGLSGHAINLPNGDVEVLAFGEAQALAELSAWLQTGPPLANVLQVRECDVKWQELSGFSIG
jgi:acylphosphatase